MGMPGQPMGMPGQPMGMPGQPMMPGQPVMTDPTSPASQRATHLPTVSIREFRSSVPEVSPRGATDMFMTTLIRTRRFRVVERARLADGIAAEKMLNQQGASTGQAGQTRYTAARYFFEGTVSEATNGEEQRGWSLGAMGAGVNNTSTSDTVAIDVRLVDVESGIAVDAQSVRKKLTGESTKAGGMINALAGMFLPAKAAQVAQGMQPVDEVVSARKDSIDKALREAMEEAVAEIVKRMPAGD